MTIAASPNETGRPNHRLKGILFLCFGASIFSLQDVVVKTVSGSFSPCTRKSTKAPVDLPIQLRCMLLMDSDQSRLSKSCSSLSA